MGLCSARGSGAVQPLTAVPKSLLVPVLVFGHAAARWAVLHVVVSRCVRTPWSGQDLQM